MQAALAAQACLLFSILLCLLWSYVTVLWRGCIFCLVFPVIFLLRGCFVVFFFFLWSNYRQCRLGSGEELSSWQLKTIVEQKQA